MMNMAAKTGILKTISGLTIHAEHDVLTNASITLKDGKITQINETSTDNIAVRTDDKLVLPNSWHLIPGMIDMHIHGAAAADVMDGTEVALQTISQALVREGVTGFLATTMTAEQHKIAATLATINEYIIQQHQEQIGAELLGIHLEGPFISKAKAGAQNITNIINPNMKLCKQWLNLTNNNIKVITLAPEINSGINLIKFLHVNGIIAAIGHSNATYEQTAQAIQAGCNHATHLFNAMRPIHHRDPGCIAALLLDPKTTIELIADNNHLHPKIIELAYKLKGKDKVILVTDAMRAKNMPDGTYNLGGQVVLVANQVARLKNNKLAGSVLTMDQALRNIMRITKCSLNDAIQMTTINPAKKIGVDARKGSIAINKDADLVVLNSAYQVMLTICRGKIVYCHELV